MRLVTRSAELGDRVAIVLDDDVVVDVDDLLDDGPWTMRRLIEAGETALERLRARLAAVGPRVGRPLADIDILAPVTHPGKIIAIGRNYAEHASEEGVAAPSDPILFTKFATAIVGDGADIVWRVADSEQVDWEAELAVIIERSARDVPVDQALDHVFGYTCLNDVSARDLQFGDGQWVRGKSLDTFCPLGPWVVTADAIPDPGVLGIRCRVDGELVQEANTSQMIHGVARLIAFCSRYMTLEPADIIATGTPAGVGVFRDPPRFLHDGNVVEVEIDQIGRLHNRCRVVDSDVL
jgi:2,4-didehydro-3-deoxy-L-rhamnonate hydrolase